MGACCAESSVPFQMNSCAFHRKEQMRKLNSHSEIAANFQADR